MRKSRPYVVAFILSLLIYAPIMWVAAAQGRPDYISHEQLIAKRLQGETIQISHYLYYSIYILYSSLTPRSTFPFPYISFATVLTFMLPLPLVILAYLKRAARDLLSDSLLVAMSLGLALVAPIMIWANEFMIGYLNPIVYHNPTLIALRLFAIPVSWFALLVFTAKQERASSKQFRYLLLCAAMIFVSTTAKPSYLIALIPGCCIFAVWRQWRRQPVDWVLLIVGIMLPGLILLGLQHMNTYFYHADNSSIALGFMVFFEHHIPLSNIPFQFPLSIVFPLGVLMLYSDEAQGHVNLALSWIIFGVGAFITYFFHETGPREQAGNFIWTGYIATFVLMYASLSFVIEQLVIELRAGTPRGILGLPESRRVRIALLLFGCHVLSGIIYYWHFMMYPPPY